MMAEPNGLNRESSASRFLFSKAGFIPGRRVEISALRGAGPEQGDAEGGLGSEARFDSCDAGGGRGRKG